MGGIGAARYSYSKFTRSGLVFYPIIKCPAHAGGGGGLEQVHFQVTASLQTDRHVAPHSLIVSCFSSSLLAAGSECARVCVCVRVCQLLSLARYVCVLAVAYYIPCNVVRLFSGRQDFLVALLFWSSLRMHDCTQQSATHTHTHYRIQAFPDCTSHLGGIIGAGGGGGGVAWPSLGLAQNV